MSAPSKTKSSFILFLTIFISLVGGTLYFPLVPFLIDHYFNGTIQNPLFFQRAFSLCKELAESLNPSNAYFLTKVLFGGLLGCTYCFAQYVSAPICGRLSDKIGRKKVLLVTLLGASLGYIPWLCSKTFEGLFLTQLFCGLMGGNIAVTMAAFADISSRETRAKAMSLNSVALSAGFIIGPILGSLLATENASLSSNNPFALIPLFAFLFALTNFFLCLLFFQETHTVSNETLPSYPKTPAIKKTSLIYFMFSAIFRGIDFTLTFLAVERLGFNIGKNSLIFVYVRIVVVFTQAVLFPFSLQYIPVRTLLFFGISCGSLSFFCTSITCHIVSFLICLTLMALSNGLVYPGISTLASLYAPKEKQGYFLGLFRSTGALARAIAPAIAAILYFLFGSRFYYLLGAVGLFLCLGLVWQLPKTLQNKK